MIGETVKALLCNMYKDLYQFKFNYFNEANHPYWPVNSYQ